MKISILFTFLNLVMTDVTKAQLVKMCLEDAMPSGHARSDPIINQNCASGHVHTNFHPNTKYEDLLDTPPRFSSSPFNENQSLYWHPTVYEVNEDGGTKTFVRAHTRATAYYRWDKSVVPSTEAFPPGFRMIAHSNDAGADKGEIGGGYNLVVECCRDGTRNCESFDYLTFPVMKCDLMEIFFSMPTCWDGKSLGDDNDHKSHMRYTTNGKVTGPCPEGFNRRLPQIELNINIGLGNYDGIAKRYQLSDGAGVYHVDFFNGWQEGKLQDIIDNCPHHQGSNDLRNPPCSCIPRFDGTDFLSHNQEYTGIICDSEVRRLIIDEATDITNRLPMGECKGPALVPRSWSQLSDGIFNTCDPLNGWEEPVRDEDEENSEEEESEEEWEEPTQDEEENNFEEESEEEWEEPSHNEEEYNFEEESEEESEEEWEEPSHNEEEHNFEEESEEESEEEWEEPSLDGEENNFEGESEEEWTEPSLDEEENNFEEESEEELNDEEVAEDEEENIFVRPEEEVEEEANFELPFEEGETGFEGVNDEEFCFSGSNLVQTSNGRYKRMNELVLGDYVQTSTGYSRIYSMLHTNHVVMTEYLQFYFEKTTKPLEVTHRHLMFVAGVQNVIPASHVKVGDKLLSPFGTAMEVTKIGIARRKGAYAPLTESGTMIVSDVAASCYVSIMGLDTNYHLDLHKWSHVAVGWRRWLCSSSSWYAHQCKNETYTNEGIAKWAYTMLRIVKWVLLPIQLSTTSIAFLLGLLAFFVRPRNQKRKCV